MIEFILINIVECNGKFTLISPLFTAYMPILMMLNLLALQTFFQVVMFKFFAGFNLILISIEVFTWVQYAFMFLLLLEEDFYLYDFRIVRYISLGAAVIFLTFYAALAAMELDLIYLKGRI